jgi:site-specific DNA-methyltransferase (adenine-specific)
MSIDKMELNKIYLEDCFETFKKIPDKSIDLILTDPPYGVTACKWDIVPDLDRLWIELKRIGKDNCAYVFTSSQPFTTDLINSNRMWFKYEWVWDKIQGANFLNLKNRPFKTHENILVFSGVNNFTFNPIRTMRSASSLKRDPIGSSRTIKQKNNNAEYYGELKRTTGKPISIDGGKHPIDILSFSTREAGIVYKIKHPTKKPIALFGYLIKTYTNENDTVLDPFMGSGTTAIACINTKRNYIGSEINKDYYNIAIKRIEDAS